MSELKSQIEGPAKLFEIEWIEAALLNIRSTRAQSKGSSVEDVASSSQVRDANWNKSVRATLSAMRKSRKLATGAPRSKYRPVPQPCYQVDDAHTDAERALRVKLVDLGTGKLKHPDITANQGKQDQYTIEASLTALSQICEMRRSAVVSLLHSLIKKKTIRVLTRGKCRHHSTVYVIDPLEDVQVARCSRNGATPEARIGVDPYGNVWHNNRSKSKRLLCEKELNEWLLSAIGGQQLVGASQAQKPGECLHS